MGRFLREFSMWPLLIEVVSRHAGKYSMLERCEATVAHILGNDVWSAAGTLRPPYRDDDPLAAMRGIMLSTLLSLIAFWMPLAIALTR